MKPRTKPPKAASAAAATREEVIRRLERLATEVAKKEDTAGIWMLKVGAFRYVISEIRRAKGWR